MATFSYCQSKILGQKFASKYYLKEYAYLFNTEKVDQCFFVWTGFGQKSAMLYVKTWTDFVV